MARQWRIEYEGAIYHILSRGNQKQPIFKDDKDRYVFLDIISEATDRFPIEVYAYVLMGNHYHLMLKTIDPVLSRTMQWIGTTYTRRFNLRHDQSGHLFQGRFKSIIVENEAYLARLSYYIHRNPLRAGIVDRLSEYQWSSYNAYAYKMKKPVWLNIDCVLAQSRAKDKHRAYRLKVQQYAEEKTSVWEDVRHGLLYGSDQFIEKLKSKFLMDRSDAELPQHNRLRRDINYVELINKASSILKYDLALFTRPGRLPKKIKQKRDILIFFLWKTTGMSNQQIGELFQLTYSSISKIAKDFRQQYDKDGELAKRYDALISNFKV